jgi:hypothetical protein
MDSLPDLSASVPRPDVVIAVSDVQPEGAIVSQDPPHLCKHLDELLCEALRSALLSDLLRVAVVT